MTDTTSTTAYNYRDNYIEAQPTWLVIDATGALKAWTGSVVRNHLSVDHIIELDMIVTFFTSGLMQGQRLTKAQRQGLSKNQWLLLADFISSMGVQAVTGADVSRPLNSDISHQYHDVVRCIG